jgi:hypothetical protein
MKSSTLLSLTIITLTSAPPTLAGPLAYGICQAGCAAVVTACYSAAGKTSLISFYPSFSLLALLADGNLVL